MDQTNFEKSMISTIKKLKNLENLIFLNEKAIIEENLITLLKLKHLVNLRILSIKLLNSTKILDLVTNIKNITNLQKLNIIYENDFDSDSNNIINVISSFEELERFESVNLNNVYFTPKSTLPELFSSVKFNDLSISFDINESNKDILIDGLFKNTFIQKLNIENSPISSKNFEILKFVFYCKSLQKLNLSNCNLLDESIYYLSESISEMKMLKSLIIQRNKLTISSISHFCKLIEKSNSLVKLDLSSNWFGFESLILIIKSLPKTKTLQKLYFQNNFFDINLMKTFEKNTKIEFIDNKNDSFNFLDISFGFINEDLFKILFKVLDSYTNQIIKIKAKRCIISEEYLAKFLKVKQKPKNSKKFFLNYYIVPSSSEKYKSQPSFLFFKKANNIIKQSKYKVTL